MNGLSDGNSNSNDFTDIGLLDTLYEGENSIVYRAIDLGTSLPRVVKYHRQQYPTEHQKNKFAKEYEIGRKLENIPFVIRYYRFCKTNHGKSNAIIMEDFQGESLHSILSTIGRFKLHDFLELATKMLEGLSYIHQQGVIHQSLNPKHVLICRRTGLIKFTDFGLSTLLNKKFQATVSLKDFENMLEWISPEQTGRMNKDVDYRTDFYSLGVLFYRMICGQVPFSSTDSSKVVYAHIAKLPQSPHKLIPDVPEAISNIILRLLAKNAEDRYQSIYGIKMDLKHCLELLRINKPIDNFDLCKHDVKSTFQICQKMYGREKEIQRLLESFDKVSKGQLPTKLVLVSGYSGIGKTRLINEVHKPLIRDKGYFISGKIDQFAKGSPYSSIVQAFKQLIQTLLSEPQDRISYWKSRLSAALKQQGQVIVDVIPEVEMIIGPQPPVAQLGPSENQHRFKATFTEFIHAFADKSHPLVIFLDDLQWADLPTLQLMESVLTNPDMKHLLIIGAFRDNEVSDVHPLCMMINRLRQKINVADITLRPLTTNHVNQLIADTLGCSLERCAKLTELVVEKTLGNPFFVQMFLVNLAQEEAVHFNHVEGRWEWDVNKIASKNITENVASMMMHRIQKLDSNTQHVLSLAAAIGNKFELNTLSIICKSSLQDTATALWPAIKEELVLVHGEETGFALANIQMRLDGILCQFLHDQVQRAAYHLVDDTTRRHSHLNIGRLLLQSLSPEQLEEKIFDVAFHFQAAASLLSDPTENLELAKLFYRASQRAKDSSAYFPAYEYASFGTKLLPPHSWETNYDITFNLYKQLVECDYLRGSFDSAESLYPVILDRCQSIHDKTKVYMIQIQQYEIQSRYMEVIDTIRTCLLFYDVTIPDIRETEENLTLALHKANDDIQRCLNGRQIMGMINNPPMTDLSQKFVLRLLVWLWAPTYCVGHKTYLMLASTLMAAYTLRHGNSDLSSISYTAYSFSHSWMSKDYQQSFEFGKLGVDLLDVYPNEPLRCRCYFVFGTGPSNLKMPITEVVPYLDKGMDFALTYGDISYACYMSHHRLSHRYFSGMPLSGLGPMLKQTFSFLKRNNMFIYYYGFAGTLPLRFHQQMEDMGETEFIEANQQNKINIGAYYVGKVQCLFWTGDRDYSTVFKYIDLAVGLIEGVMGFYVEKELFFVIAMLLMAAKCSGHELNDKQESLIEAYTRETELLAKYSPHNTQHKALLLQAEKARMEGREMDCLLLYNKAQSAANAHGFMQYEALANELAGRLWHSKSMYNYAKTHFKEAYYLYSNWGSKPKMAEMKKSFGRYLSSFDAEENQALKDDVDVQTVIRVSEALSGDKSLEELLDTMMKLVLEDSGAQRGAFMLAENEGSSLLLVAEGDMDAMQVDTIRAIPLNSSSNYPDSIINYVTRTKETVIINDATKSSLFVNDSYLDTKPVKSILCVPLIRNNIFKGVIYLENTMLSDVFNEQRIKVVGIIATQILMHLENAKFSHLLESEKKYRSLSSELVLAKKKLEEFIDVLCHELRNPLNGIYGNAQFLDELLASLGEEVSNLKVEKKTDLESCVAEMKEMLNGIVVSSNHLKDIVDTVLNASRVEKQDKTLQNVPFNPADITEKVLAMFKAKTKEKSIYLKTSLPRECGLMIGDAYRITQVLINLVSNAIKFTVEGGITIALEIEQSDGKVVLNFSVTDTGIGMTEEEQQKLFRPFSQANSSTNVKYGGSGLGLAISKELVELMGGTITLESKPGQGTTFRFNVICQQAPEEAANNGTSSAKRKLNEVDHHSTSNHAKVSRKQRVLIVDDNAINQNLMKRILDREGYTTELVGNGKEALDKITTTFATPQAFDVILMDLEMPIMNGIEATQKIRAFEKQQGVQQPLLIVGVSANAREYHSQNAIEIGMNGYITKPFQKKDILTAIQNEKDQ